jgi:succinyl-diaminopimelate desuccinylase
VAIDLLELTAELVAIPSVSRDEAAISTWLANELDEVPWLRVDRVGDNVVARTELGRDHRLLLVGHTDTVPGSGRDGEDLARIEGDRVWGLGATDMKGGLAVMLAAARTVRAPAVDVSYVFYAREEIAASESGLLELYAHRPELLAGDAALIGEPTEGAVEAGCQGSLRVEVVLRGHRAHTARPWMGRNAIHRLHPVLAVLDAYEGRRPVLDGCEYREALQAVQVRGGVAGNVVPDQVELLINHRFAPDRSPDDAAQHVIDVVGDALEPDDELRVVDISPAATPGLGHPLLAALVERNHLAVRAKLGWTDVARFVEHGTPATNFGPGIAELAHTPGEFVERDRLEAVHAAVVDLLEQGP